MITFTYAFLGLTKLILWYLSSHDKAHELLLRVLAANYH